MKALLRIVAVIGIMSCVVVQTVAGFTVKEVINRPYDEKADEQGEAAVEFGDVIKEDAIEDDQKVSEQIQEEFGIAYQNADDQRATFYIKEAINRFLAIAGLVALVVLIYGFYKMFASGDNEEAYSEARKIVIGAVVALLAIGVSRFIVSRFFEIFFQVKQGVASN